MGDLTFAEALRHLRAEAGKLPQPGEPMQLALDSIKTATAVFQPRDVEAAAAALASDSHVKVLAEAIKDNGASAFDPLVVWWSGSHWYVIDGHHRLIAFKKVKADHPKLRINAAPVAVFAGTLNEAIKQSVERNSKDKLPMRKDDKLESAWKLVSMGGMTKDQIHRATTISERTIATMRKKLRELVDRNIDPLDWTWLEAKNEQRDIKVDDDWIEKQAHDWMRRFLKLFGRKLIEQPQIAARALELYSDRLPVELIRYWPDEARAMLAEEAESEF